MKLKANNINIFSSFDDLKNSSLNKPFDKDKYNRLINKMNEFHNKLQELEKIKPINEINNKMV